MRKYTGKQAIVDGLSSKGEKEAFKTFQKISEGASAVDTSSVDQLGKMTSDFIAASREAASRAETEQERTRIIDGMREALRDARQDIKDVNERSHESQRGFATITMKFALSIAAAGVGGALWILSKK